ncbi:MAG: ABC transporter permease [Gemmatimonadetes bacterium]|nr:ABC transporter permease [Gemmatimonadota bacterium]
MAATLGQLSRLAWRESRTARRRLLLYMSSISLGVAALVAIDSFASNVTRSIREQSRALLGGDISLNSNAKWTVQQDSIFGALTAKGATLAKQVQFASMATSPGSQATRLAQVRAVGRGFPIYGEITTSPPGQYERIHDAPIAVVDEQLLQVLNVKVGDTLAVGQGRFQIAGTLADVPGDPGLSSIVGPRVYIGDEFLNTTGLLVFGSRAQFEVLVKAPPGIAPAVLLIQYNKKLEEARVRTRTVAENERNLTSAIGQLGDFLGIVGLVALLLGGVGVASGVNAFVARKMDTVAVLRCLGATSPQVLFIYVVQSVAMGLVGSGIGVLIGVVTQFALPQVLGDFLPVNVRVALEPRAILTGLAIGSWVALIFSLRPLLALRTVSPLQALRRDADPTVLRVKLADWPRLTVDVAMIVSVVWLAAARAGSYERGFALAAGIAVALLVLAASAASLSWLARKLLRQGWPYVMRQGVANLYRPANQTRAVVLSLGFGAFLVTTLFLVQANLLKQFDGARAASRANLLLFDVQDDQAPGIDSILAAHQQVALQRTPIVTMRIAGINQWNMTQMLDPANPDSVMRATWALRREYRSSYRAKMLDGEKLVAGQWFGRRAARDGEPQAEVSLDKELAKDLGVKLGDIMTWDVQGLKIKTRVTSFREVNWARFEPNFFAVFSPDAIDKAPKTFVVLASVPDAKTVMQVQRDVVGRFSNVSAIDLTLVQRTVSGIVDKVALAVRFLAVFALAIGIPVLISAVAATRRARLREGVLLKVLGATQAQISRILLAEYALLGVLGALTGMVLSFGGAWAVMTFVFKVEVALAAGPALAIAGLMLAITIGIGLLGGRDVFRETPMAALREA